MRPVLLSNIRPARIAITGVGGGHGSVPPSRPTHGVGPTPRQGVIIGFGCAQRAAAAERPNSMIPNLRCMDTLYRSKLRSYETQTRANRESYLLQREGGAARRAAERARSANWSCGASCEKLSRLIENFA
jgi:hypothetical protein